MPAQVTYPTWLAEHLHRIPITIALGLPLLLPGSAAAASARAPLSTKYLALLRATLVGLLGTIGSIVVPILYSAAFVPVTGITPLSLRQWARNDRYNDSPRWSF